jgi:hypothetical protein
MHVNMQVKLAWLHACKNMHVNMHVYMHVNMHVKHACPILRDG